MAPKRYPKVPVPAPCTIDRLKARHKQRIDVLKKDRDQWKAKAVGLERFVTVMANNMEKNTDAKKVFVSVCRLWVGGKSACSQTRTTKLGRLTRLTGAPQIVACDDVTPPPPPPSPSVPGTTSATSSSAEGGADSE